MLIMTLKNIVALVFIGLMNEDKAEPYCGNFGGTQEILLKAWVKICDVNWNTTFERAVYSLREEREINVIAGSTLELFGINLCGKEKDLMKNFDYNYFHDTFDFDWDDMNRIQNFYKSEAKDKSHMEFDPPIKIKA